MASQTLELTGPRFLLRCWGDFAIADADGAEQRPRGRKARALFAYLAMHPDKRINRERLMALLWGDRADEQARSSLRQALFELRGLANGYGPLAVERDAVMLQAFALETDIGRMKKAAQAGDYEALLGALPDGDEALFAGLDGLSDGFDDWLQVERTRQKDSLLALIREASAKAIVEGQARVARVLHTRLLELDPNGATPAPTLFSTLMPTSASPAQPTRRGLMTGLALAVAGGATALSGAFWLRSRGPATNAMPDREAQGLYEAAHEIVYNRKSRQYPAAFTLLRRALAIKPDHAPALASLAAVTAMTGQALADKVEAEKLVRRAIEIDPALAEAHGVLGMVLDFKTPEARAAIRRAAALEMHDPQIQFWLSHILGNDGDFIGQLQALRRAVATDPLWYRASGTAALAAWSLGFADEADAHAARLRDIDIRASFQCAYAIDWARGNYSDVVHDTFANRQRLDSDAADWKLGVALLVLGHIEPARLLLRIPPRLWRVASGAGPAPGDLEPMLIEVGSDQRIDFYLPTAMRQVLKAGRPAEIVTAYDRRIGFLADLYNSRVSIGAFVLEGLQVALALRAVGRTREADSILARADATILRSLAHGLIPNWLDAGSAGVWAAQGRMTDAIDALERAMQRGWHYSPMTPMPDLSEDPSFFALRGNPRFERLRKLEREHLKRERRKLGPVPA